jgi:hypothetical protein
MEVMEVTRVPATRMHKEGGSFFPFAVAILDASLSAHRDHHGDEDNHPAGGGGPPTIDLGPMGDQPPPEPTGDANPKPGGQDPGESAPPHHESKDGVDPNVGDGGSKSVDESTPGKTTNADNPAPPPPKPGLDPGAGKSTPEIPVFLGPTNSNPPPGSSGPPSDAPQDLGYPGDEGRNGYTEDTSCDDLFGESLINLMSNNGGDGGDASSGAATRQERTFPLVHVANSRHVLKFRGWWEW